MDQHDHVEQRVSVTVIVMIELKVVQNLVIRIAAMLMRIDQGLSNRLNERFKGSLRINLIINRQ
ncbi:hypothetical protein D3C84_1090360 [compost metagenome]